jgi:hypothetical protein
LPLEAGVIAGGEVPVRNHAKESPPIGKNDGSDSGEFNLKDTSFRVFVIDPDLSTEHIDYGIDQIQPNARFRNLKSYLLLIKRQQAEFHGSPDPW